EVITIAAALSIQDPRERPAEQRAQADQQHARFAGESSDFLAYLNLWRYLREQQRALSGNQFRKRVKAEYLHYLRIREWQDLAAQLRGAAKEVGVHLNREPAEPADIHQALLAGLLSHIGLRDTATRDYLGARGARFAIFPGSSLARRGPTWVMAAELVETSRLWGRTAARIEPSWVEPLAGHLVNRTYSEPRWDPRRAQVVATERVTLYGLPIVTGRSVAYARIDPELSRALFLRRALVEGEWDGRHEFLAENARRVAEVEALEERVRRRDLLAGDEVRLDFFDARVPADVVSGAHFDRWWRDARRADPELLTYPRELLVVPETRDVLDPQARPTGWRAGDQILRLSYRFEPGHEHDGVTVHVPVTSLPALQADGFDWLVPALRLELVTALLRGLPKELRRPLVPVPETAARLLARLKPRTGPLLEALAREAGVPAGAFDPSKLPPHLRMTYSVEADDGDVLAVGEDLDAVREAVKPRLRAQLTDATAALERSGLTTWDGIDELPRRVELSGATGFPALVDEGASVGVRTLETADAQAASMRAGTRRLLALTVPSPARFVEGRLDNAAKLSLLGAPHGSVGAVLADATEAALDALLARAGGPAWDAGGFERLRAEVAGDLADTTAEVVGQVVRILDAYREVQDRLGKAIGDALRPARLDVAGQIGGLVYDGFVTATGVARLPDVERYLQAAARRLERLPTQVAADADRMKAVHELEAAYRRSPNAPPEVRWMLEELRVSHFAQGLGVKGQISSKRIRRALAG
ncbi:MAG: ATP-dependent helicase HrpA, partial [Solirubrobacteraceae bacterium]|nr:ATP-dependent helicase HrpA [Solirubrobacteraceae bacterium]